MSIDIQPVLFDFLSRRKSVVLPGLGTLVWTQISSLTGPSSNVLDPPTVILQLENEIGTPIDFINHIASKLDLSLDYAESVLHTWIHDVKLKLSKGNAVPIDNLGTFRGSNESPIIFEPNGTFIDVAFYLPSIKLKPITRSGKQEIRFVPVKIQDENAISKWLINGLIPIVLIAAIAVLLYFLLHQLKTPQTGNAPHKVEVAESVDEYLPDGKKEAASVMDTADNVDSNSGNNVLTDSTLTEEVLIDGGEESRLHDFENKFCIIILGSFKRREYAELLMQKIKNEGLVVYTEDYMEYQRVGVKFDCYTKDLYRTLFQLRGQFAEDAWILKYK